MSLGSRLKEKLPTVSDRSRRIFAILTTFFVGQGLTQILGFLTGFLLVRWMSIDEYAKYGLVFAFQCMINQIVDIGFNSSIVALAGSRATDPSIMGSYIQSAKYFRVRLLIIVIPAAFAAFWILSDKHGWGWETRIFLFGAITLSIIYQGIGAWYSAPLIVHRNLSATYRISLISNLFRLITTLLLHLSALLFALTACASSAVSMVINALLIKKEARPLVIEPPRSDPALRREMFRYIAPQVPSIIFYAFEGQITTFMISIFGKTASIAEISALGRIGQIFAILGLINGTIVLPYFAKLQHAEVGRRCVELFGVIIVFSTTVTLLSFVFPAPLLWLLGNKYSHLQTELGWAVANSCIALLLHAVYTITMARKWIQWWYPLFSIGVLLTAQISGMLFMNLSTTLNVLRFSVFMTLVNLAIQIVVNIYGYRLDNRAENEVLLARIRLESDDHAGP